MSARQTALGLFYILNSLKKSFSKKKNNLSIFLLLTNFSLRVSGSIQDFLFMESHNLVTF